MDVHLLAVIVLLAITKRMCQNIIKYLKYNNVITGCVEFGALVLK